MSVTHQRRTTLLDLPSELLSNCILQDVDHPWCQTSIEPCMAASKHMLQALLKGTDRGRLGLRVALLPPEDLPAKKASIQFLSKAFPSLQKLSILGCSTPVMDGLTSLLEAPQGTEQLGTGWLKNITRLRLATYGLGKLLVPHPVPVSVATACPGLKELKLDWVICSNLLHNEVVIRGQEQQNRIAKEQASSQQPATDAHTKLMAAAHAAWVKKTERMLQDSILLQHHVLSLLPTDPITPPISLPHLQSLKLQYCSLWNSAAAFKQQLQALPNLQGLSLVGCLFLAEDMPQEYAAAVADSCSGQLTRLQWQDRYQLSLQEGMKDMHVAVLLGKPYAQLQQLCMPFATIDDSIMELLLQNAHHLKKLQAAGFKLQGDFSHRQCSWEAVMVGHSLDIASLPRIPLSTSSRLLVKSKHSPVKLAIADEGTAAEDLQLTAAAAAAVERCGGILPSEGVSNPLTTFILDAAGIRHAEQGRAARLDKLVLATIPMLSNTAGCISFDSLCITRGLLTAISTHLPHCSRLQFSENCTFEQGIWGTLVSLLPKVTHLVVFSDAASLQQLLVLCVTATRRITMEVSVGWFPDPRHGNFTAWKAMVQRAQRDAGHSYVNVVCEDNLDEYDDMVV